MRFDCREKPNHTKLRKAILDCPFKAEATKERLARLGRCEVCKAFLEKLKARRAAAEAGPSEAEAATEFDDGVKQARRGPGPAGEKDALRQTMITDMVGMDKGLTKAQVEAARHYLALFFYMCRLSFLASECWALSMAIMVLRPTFWAHHKV